MAYVDGFVLPLPKTNVESYRKMAAKCGAIWREHGALEFRECIADDVKPGKLTSFPQSVNLEDGESVVFSWIVYESRAHRDEVNDKVMKDPRMAEMMNPESMPFDGKRMIYGGFEMIVDL
ncbi:MAG: signal recognition particle [Herminiimonas sp.]|nr:signal recognition particle [Herminiimonas sp.]